MSTTTVTSPASQVRFGTARTDITPPIGIYHRMWGAARHDQATGVHRALVGDVMVFGPIEGSASPFVRAELDLVGLAPGQHDELARILGEAAGVSQDRVVVTYSHTHSGGFFVPDRASHPGGELIAPYLQHVGEALGAACRAAVAVMAEVTITYATGRCSLAANRDYWDDSLQGYACGFNPDGPADDTVLVARMVDTSGRMVATLVNYGCHPTTLAWDNSLISPDYVGAMREVMERETGAPCIFALGACGDLGPRYGLVGDPEVADLNGRQLAYAALSALASLGPSGTDLRYAGPVISGATLGAWAYTPFTPDRQESVARFEGGTYTAPLALKPRPTRAALEDDLGRWQAQHRDAEERGDALAARDSSARAERARRWLGRLDFLPEDATTYPLPFSVLRMGEACWVTCGGEPYSAIQMELRRRFPAEIIIFSPLAGAFPVAYLLPARSLWQGAVSGGALVPCAWLSGGARRGHCRNPTSIIRWQVGRPTRVTDLYDQRPSGQAPNPWVEVFGLERGNLDAALPYVGILSMARVSIPCAGLSVPRCGPRQIVRRCRE